MLQNILSQLLKRLANQLDSGECNNFSDKDVEQYCKMLSEFTNDEKISKSEACQILNISRSTFDQYVSLNLIPKGIKQAGFKELYWKRTQIEILKTKFPR